MLRIWPRPCYFHLIYLIKYYVIQAVKGLGNFAAISKNMNPSFTSFLFSFGLVKPLCILLSVNENKASSVEIFSRNPNCLADIIL